MCIVRTVRSRCWYELLLKFTSQRASPNIVLAYIYNIGTYRNINGHPTPLSWFASEEGFATVDQDGEVYRAAECSFLWHESVPAAGLSIWIVSTFLYCIGCNRFHVRNFFLAEILLYSRTILWPVGVFFFIIFSLPRALCILMHILHEIIKCAVKEFAPVEL